VRRRVLVALGAALLWLPVADNLPAAQPPGADWSRPNSVQAGGLKVYYPRAWNASVDKGTIVISSPHAWIWLAHYGPKFADEWPARPEHFELRDEDFGFQSCGFGFEGWNLGFTDHGQVMQAIIRRYPGANESDVIEVLDRLVVG
jgi:hypothetical protein